MRAIDLALKDLSQIFRDWKAALFLVLMPVGFTLLFGFVFAGAGDGDSRLPVGFVDLDDGRPTSAHLLTLLDASESIRPEVWDSEDVEGAKEQVGAGDWAAAVIVPAGFSDGALRTGGDDRLRLVIVVDPASNAGHSARTGIQRAVLRLMSATEAARLTAQAYETQGGTVDSEFLENTLERAIGAWDDPPLEVIANQAGVAGEAANQPEAAANDFAHSSAGIMVQFAMAGLIGAAEILVLERKSGSLQRLLTTPISRLEIIVGHYLAMYAMVLFQLVILVAFGQIFLDVEYMSAPLATALMIGVTAFWAASLGLLIGTFARTEEQVIIITLILMLVLAGLGGAWMPLEFTSEAFQTVGHLTPTAWAIDGFENIVVRGQGLASVWLPALVTLGFGLAFFALAAWRFEFE
jgi:ABC-2 type transport system permease protein